MNSTVLPVPPSVNKLYSHSRYGVRLSQEARDFRELVQWTVPVRLLSGQLVLVIDYYRPRKKGDIDGIIKLLMDSLQGRWYENDEQITTLLVRRHEDKTNPRVEVKCGYTAEFILEWP